VGKWGLSRYLQSLAPTNPRWARMVGNGPFSLCVIHKEGLCPSSGDINRLMMYVWCIDNRERLEYLLYFILLPRTPHRTVGHVRQFFSSYFVLFSLLCTIRFCQKHLHFSQAFSRVHVKLIYKHRPRIDFCFHNKDSFIMKFFRCFHRMARLLK
jgi:hypothetical protein